MVMSLLRQVFITPFGVLRFMDRLGDPTLKTLTKAVDTMRASMLSVIQVKACVQCCSAHVFRAAAAAVQSEELSSSID